MMDFLLKLLGVWSERADKIVKISPSFHGDVAMWFVILLWLVLAAAVFWMYHTTAGTLTPARRYTLAALRSLFLLLVLLILVRPILAVTVAGSVRQSLLLLIDSSSSMQIKDIRDQDADVKRAAIAKGEIDASGGLGQSVKNNPGLHDPARIDLVKEAFKNDKLRLLKRLAKDYDIDGFTFDRDLRDLPVGKPEPKPGDEKQAPAKVVADETAWINAIAASGTSTALGDAVSNLRLRKQGQPVAGIWLITDGANNSGSLPIEAAKMAKEEGMPLYIYGVGITSPKDIIVGNVFVNDVAFVKDEVPLTVRVRGQGMKGQRGMLVLKYKGEKVDEKEVNFEDDAEQAISMKFTPQQVGEGDLQASIDPRTDEVVKDNNYSAPKHLRVIDGRIKVLHVETLPRWEFKYLQAMLMRDRRVDYKCILLEGDPSITEGPNTPYVKEFPKLGDLAKNYDVVILGDVDPKRLTPQNLTDLNEFVSRAGGAMVMVAGRKFSPLAYRNTPVEKMLPVEFEGSEGVAAAATDRPIKLELTQAGKESTMLRLSDKEQENQTKWVGLPPIYWESRVARAKPAAIVLLVDSDPGKATRFGKMPVMALQQYGVGQVLYVGTDNTWRWRKNLNDTSFVTIWSQTIEQLSRPHLLGVSKRTQLSTDREKYATGDRVTILARLYREKDFEPMTEPTVHGYFQSMGGTGADKEANVVLRQLPDQPGMYRAELVAPAAGTYQFRVETDNDTKLDFVVADPKLEMGETALNEPLLREMAEKSGGQFFREEELYKLPDEIRNTSQPVLSTVEVELWCSPIYFLLLLAVVTTEWILRKFAQLK